MQFTQEKLDELLAGRNHFEYADRIYLYLGAAIVKPRLNDDGSTKNVKVSVEYKGANVTYTSRIPLTCEILKNNGASYVVTTMEGISVDGYKSTKKEGEYDETTETLFERGSGTIRSAELIYNRRGKAITAKWEENMDLDAYVSMNKKATQALTAYNNSVEPENKLASVNELRDKVEEELSEFEATLSFALPPMDEVIKGVEKNDKRKKK